MNIQKKLGTLLLSVVMVVSLCPSMALATETIANNAQEIDSSLANTIGTETNTSSDQSAPQDQGSLPTLDGEANIAPSIPGEGDNNEPPLICTCDTQCTQEALNEECPLCVNDSTVCMGTPSAIEENTLCVLTEGCLLEVGHVGACVTSPSDEITSEVLSTEEELANMIAALPDPADVNPNDQQQLDEIYTQLSDIYVFAEDNGLSVDDNERINLLVATLWPAEELDEPTDTVNKDPKADDPVTKSDWEECDTCSPDNPHMIYTTADLDKIRTHTHTVDGTTTVTGYFKLANDIVFEESDFQEGGQFYNNGWGWKPIGHNDISSYFSGDKFCGDLDGNQRSVKNLYISRPSGYWYNGIIAALGEGAYIHDLTFDGFSINADSAGVLCGQVYSSNVKMEEITVKNCHITGILTSSKPSGIFVGCSNGVMRNITIIDCVYDGKAAWHGGFIASDISGLIENIEVTGCTLKPYAYAGLLGSGIGLSGSGIGGNVSINSISITDCKVEPTHSAWNYLIWDDFRSESSGQTLSINDVTIDVKIAHDNPSIGSAIKLLPKQKSTNSSADLDDIDICVTYEGEGAVHTKVRKNVIYVLDQRDISKGKVVVNDDEYIVDLNGGELDQNGNYEQGKLAIPIRDGFIFDGWYIDRTCSGTAVADLQPGTMYYAKWLELKIPDSITMEYGSSPVSLPVLKGVTLSNWQFDDVAIASIEDGKLKATKAGETTLRATATTIAGGSVTLQFKIKVTPKLIIYGPKEMGSGGLVYDKDDGRPDIIYSLNNGMAPSLSDFLSFYPAEVNEDSGQITYTPNTTAGVIPLTLGTSANADIEYVYKNDASGNEIITNTLPVHLTVDSDDNPHSIDVKVKLKNPNYKFCTVGTEWKPSDTITLHVTCYEEGMREVDMYLKGDTKPLVTFDDRHTYEYTGEGIVPTTRDLTTLYTKTKDGQDTDPAPITTFTAHFHPVSETSDFEATHMQGVESSALTSEALKAIAPTKPGVYSFVVNGNNEDTNSYCYASRRYQITPGVPKGTPSFEKAYSSVELSSVALSGVMKNCIGTEVPGTFVWDDSAQTVSPNVSYSWTFTPDDTECYTSTSGTSIVWPYTPDPVYPVEPEDSTTPENPDDPTTPTDPENPDVPANPDDNNNPGDNTTPGTDPTTPDDGKDDPIDNPTTNKSGTWEKNETGWWYQNPDGTYPTNTWQKINNQWYHFDAKGYMQTGWLHDGGTWYYLHKAADGTEGAMATGWQKINNRWYYLSTSGAMQTGWQKINGNWYYLTKPGEGIEGAMKTGWLNDNGTWYYLEPTGAMTTGWKQVDGLWYYLNASGAMQSGWQKINGAWYYLNTSHDSTFGAMQANTWIEGYYLGPDGAWVY